MKNIQLVESYAKKLQKALKHLAYSYAKIQTLPDNIENLDDEALEVWESFAIRFSRVADIYMTRYLRAKVLLEDPGFNGTVRDLLNFSEKLHYIDSTDDWIAIRGLRNSVAHEYAEKDLQKFYQSLRNYCPILLGIKL